MVHSRVDANCLLVLLLAGFALAPLTYPGFVQAWQGFAPAYALQDLRAGLPLEFWGVAWPPRAGAEGPLPYLLSAAWTALGASPVAALRWTWAAGILLGALGAYTWLRGSWGPVPALLGAVAYTYTPYFLNALYARGVLGEALALGTLPWLGWAVTRTGWKRPLALALGLGALVLTLPGLAFLAAWPLGALAALHGRSRGRWTAWSLLLLGVLMGTGSAWTLVREGAPVPLHALLTVGPPLKNPWSLGLVPVAAWFGGGAAWLSPGMAEQRREVGLWLGTFLLGLLGATLWPGGLPLWTPLSLTALAVPPLVGAVAAAWPALTRTEVAAGALALVVLAAQPLLTPPFTRLDPSTAPSAVWQEPGGGRIALLRSEVRAEQGRVHLDLSWQAWGQVQGDYTLFVHLVDEDGRILAQEDAPPVGGARPTAGWRPGEIVEESRTLPLPQGTSGPLRLALGWYLPQTGERLPLVRAALPAEPDHRVWLHVP
ncbi:MAG: hypothetical protein ACP5UM_04875 [Anaerolineae bacterium]